MTVKQVIVLRKDLNMRAGKLCSQASHASMAALLRFARIEPIDEPDPDFVGTLTVQLAPAEYAWLTGKFTKICVRVESEQELMDIYHKAEAAMLPRALIVDEGLTEFKGVSTKTAVAIGPAESSKIDEITGHLKLL